MSELYIDCFSGISGDKFVASLLSLYEGKNNDVLKEALSSLQMDEEFNIEIVEKKISGIGCLKFNVIVREDNKPHNHSHNHHHKHRNFDDIKRIINKSTISERAKKYTLDIFNIIATAEAKVHNTDINSVHFHEVGAVDSIVDIVSCSVLMDLLDFECIKSSPIPLGSGFVKTEHGVLPIPAPATIEILKGIEVCNGEVMDEMTTPTGAAFIKYFVREFCGVESFEIERIGYGAGSKDFDIPNFLRVYSGKKKTPKK